MTPSELFKVIRSIPDFPKKGVVFRDITTLLKDPTAFRTVVDLFCDRYKDSRIDKIVSVESRGFIFAAPLAYKLKAGFVPIRKPGKLPAETVKQQYTLEYGTDTVEIHRDAITRGERILIHDDLLATGGTIAAASELVRRLGGKIVGLSFLIELSFLKGRDRLGNHEIYSILMYDRE